MTWRLFGSLPKNIIIKHQLDRDRYISTLRADQLSPEELERAISIAHGEYFHRCDEALDYSDTGPNWLKEPPIANVVVEKLRQYDGQYYQLDAFCIMSNHVHALMDFSIQLPECEDDFQQEQYKNLDEVMQLIKGGSAFRANQILNRKGKFWASESWDRYIRNEKHYRNVVTYILNNPVKAGICSCWTEHPYTWSREGGL